MASAKSYTLREYLLDLDPFKQPKIIGDDEAMAALLTRILLLEPGTNPLYPEMGVGLVSRYRFLMPQDDYQLKKDIDDQLSKYLPAGASHEVNFVYNDDKTVNIEVVINGTAFYYDAESLGSLSLESMKQ